jgi:hypothetical protein
MNVDFLRCGALAAALLGLLGTATGACSSASSANLAGDEARDDVGEELSGATSCAELKAKIVAFDGAHAACAAEETCERLDAPQDDPAFCGATGVLHADGKKLSTLVAAWKKKKCGSGFSCGGQPGTPACVAGRCALVDPTGMCDACPTNRDVQCTTAGNNALNPCYAKWCLQEPVAHAGACPDSAACKATRGTCELSGLDEPRRCPDGTRWNLDDPGQECPGGNLVNTCCRAWKPPCSFVAGTFGFDRDLFTCEKPTALGSGLCLNTGEQSSCAWTTTNVFTPGGAVDAEVELRAAHGNDLTLKGRHLTTGRTFECHGTASNNPLASTAWFCTACSAATDVPCRTCTVAQIGACMM